MTSSKKFKQCSKCKELKKIEEFKTDSSKNDYLYSSCKDCVKLCAKRRYNKKKKQILNQQKEWYAKNKNKVKKTRALYYKKNKKKISIYNKKWCKRNTKKMKKYHKEYFRRPKVRIYQKNKDLIKKFNITLRDYNKLLKKQDYKCAICRKSQKGSNQMLAVDHCHKTNKVRGLLCSKCNMGIGLLEDSISILQNAINYLNT